MTAEWRRVAAHHRTGRRNSPRLSEQIGGESRPEVERTTREFRTRESNGIRGVDVDRIAIVVGLRLGRLRREQSGRIAGHFVHDIVAVTAMTVMVVMLGGD